MRWTGRSPRAAQAITLAAKVRALLDNRFHVSFQDVKDVAIPAMRHRVILNFEGLEYMNSGGIGLLVTTLIRAQRSGHALRAYGLTDHYRQIFSLTRLDEAIGIFDDEASAIAG